MAGRPKGVSKTEGSGRKKGSVNKRTQFVIDTLARLKCDPIEVLAYLANGDKKALKSNKVVPYDIRVWAAKELLPYIAPKLASVQIEADIRQETKIKAVIETPARLSPAQWEHAASLSRQTHDGPNRVEAAHSAAG